LTIIVNEVREHYEVKSKRMEDDGKLSVISLSKT